MLEDGVPHTRRGMGGRAIAPPATAHRRAVACSTIRMYLPPDGQAGVTLALTALSGDAFVAAAIDQRTLNAFADLKANGTGTENWPSGGYVWQANPGATQTLSLAADSRRLANCERSQGCVLYAVVYSTAPAAYSLLATLDWADNGLRVVSPPSVAGPYPIAAAAFGAPLPRRRRARPPRRRTRRRVRAADGEDYGHLRRGGRSRARVPREVLAGRRRARRAARRRHRARLRLFDVHASWKHAPFDDGEEADQDSSRSPYSVGHDRGETLARAVADGGGTPPWWNWRRRREHRCSSMVLLSSST